MAILEEIAANFPFFEKMSPTDKEKLKIPVEAHYKLHKRKGKSHTFTTYKNGGVNRATIYRWLPGIFAMFCQSTKMNPRAPL